MLKVITEGEIRFLIEILRECALSCDDVEEAVDECLELLEGLDTYGSETISDEDYYNDY